MCDTQYDISDHMKKLFEEKQKQRLAARKYYQNLLYNPHLPPNQGAPFDPAVYRYGAMSVFHADHYKPKMKHFATYFLYFVPAMICTYRLYVAKTEQEKLLRSGAVSYADREFKLIM